MKIHTTTKALLKALRQSVKMRRRDATITILQYARLESGHLFATNLDDYSDVPLEAEGDGNILVPYSFFLKLLPGWDFDCTLEVKSPAGEPQNMKLTIGSYQASLRTDKIENYPTLPDPVPATITISKKDFCYLYDRTHFAVSDQESRYTLKGILMQVVDGVMRWVATDGHRLSVVEMPTEAGPCIHLLRKPALDWVRKHIVDSVTIGADEAPRGFTFRTGDLTFCTRSMPGQFPQWQAVMPKHYPFVLQIEDTRNLYRAISYVNRFNTFRVPGITLQFGAEPQLSCGDASSTGMITGPLPVPASETELKVGFDASFLLQFLKLAGDDPLTLSMKADDAAILFETQNWKHVIMPMRVR